MSSQPTAAESNARAARPGAGETRRRLLTAGLRLFAQNGFANTSTREIAEAAKVNVAAIAYYFGDKAGLYRAAFFEPLESPASAVASCEADAQALNLDDALRRLFVELLAPLRAGEMARLCIQLHFREMVEPTGLWAEEIEREIRPMHELLVQALTRHFGLAKADDETRRLALLIAGLGVHLHVGRDVIQALTPDLAVTPERLDDWIEHLVRYARAMADAEVARRLGYSKSATAPSPPACPTSLTTAPSSDPLAAARLLP